MAKNSVEITCAVRRVVELKDDVTWPTAMATAHAEALRAKSDPREELLAVAIVTENRRLEIGAEKLGEWGVLPDA